MSIKVVIADDHAVVIDGIKAVVGRKARNDIEIIGAVSNGMEVLEFAKEDTADVYVIDISMPVLNGVEVIDKLMKLNPNCKIIILSMHDERSLVEKAIKGGAKGYILKESATEELIRAIYEVNEDRFYISPKISKYIVEGFIGKQDHYEESEKDAVHLTGREREILQLIADGLNSNEIAGKLNISLNTVLSHRNNIMRKLEIHSQAALIRYALKKGISQL